MSIKDEVIFGAVVLYDYMRERYPPPMAATIMCYCLGMIAGSTTKTATFEDFWTDFCSANSMKVLAQKGYEAGERIKKSGVYNNQSRN